MQDLNDKVTGGTLTAAEWNEVPSEIQNVIEGLGITLSSGNLNQLGEAIAGYVANGTFYIDSGVANAYVLTQIGSKQALTSYTDGATFEFEASNPNTGAATVNVAGLGIKNIKLADGSDPIAGAIDGRVILKFDAGNDWAELIPDFEVASQAEAETGTDNTKGMTPLRSHQAFNFYGLGVETSSIVSDIDTLDSTYLRATDTSLSSGTFPVGVDKEGSILNISRTNTGKTQLFISFDNRAFFRVYTSGAWQPWVEIGSGTSRTLIVTHQLASGNNGGTTVSSTWNLRPLNTVVVNEITGASLSSNQITLPAGTYDIEAGSEVYNAAQHKARLYNVTDATDEVIGMSGFAPAASINAGGRSKIKGRFTIGATKDFRIDQWVGNGQASNGLGVAASSGAAEIYATVEIRKVS